MTKGARIAAGALVASFICATAGAQTSNLKPDEVVVFYRSCLTWDENRGEWRGSIHGNVHEPSEGKSEHLKLAAIRKLLDIDGDLTAEQERLFRRRAGLFAADNKSRRRIAVRIGERRFISGPSRLNGHFELSLALAAGRAGDVLPYTAVLSEGDAREFGGEIRLLGPTGISVISDVDDTVKKSEVLAHDELLANTFLREYEPVEGMPQLYQGWSEQGAAIHYVTGSPWQLYPELLSFLAAQRIDGVELQMRHLRLKDTSIVRFFRNPKRYKMRRIREILRRFPGRRFVLVGDSGEQDPEIYARIEREFPDLVLGIFIREVREDHHDPARYREIFDGIDQAKWIVFSDVGELPRRLDRWLDSGGG